MQAAAWLTVCVCCVIFVIAALEEVTHIGVVERIVFLQCDEVKVLQVESLLALI